MKKILYFDRYINYLIENNYSKSTITCYEIGLNLFDKYLEDNSIDNINPSVINDYIDFLNENNKKGTQKVYLNGVKKYLTFIKNNHDFKLDFDLNQIKQIVQTKKINRNIDINKLNDILNSISTHDSRSSQRDYLIINLIIRTGIRISDLVNIKKSDISENKIIINNNEFFIDAKLSKLITDFIKKSTGDSIYLFTAFSKNVDSKIDHLTNRSVEIAIKKYLNGYSYNDLKSVYYKSLIDNLPNITQIHKHLQNTSKINLQEIDVTI